MLLVATLLAYAARLPGMGYYWDDWMPLFMDHLGDPAHFWTFYAYDRPISAWTYVTAFPFLGDSAARWQLFTILLRWVTSLGMWFALGWLWPRHRQEVGWMALLLVVYPGFLQQPISVAYSQHFITYSLFTLSLAFMVASVRASRRRVFFGVFAVFAAILHLFTMEYFAGLELLRPLLLWFLLRSGHLGVSRAGLARVLRWWLPYLLVLSGFLLWRLVLYPYALPGDDPNAPGLLLRWLDQPGQESIHLIQIALQDIVHLAVFAWSNTILTDTINLASPYTLFSWTAGLAMALLAAWALLRGWPEVDEPNQGKDRFVTQGLLLGGMGILLGGLPVWLTDRQVIVGLWSDRFSLGPMFGVVILLTTLVYWFGRSAARRAVILAAFFAFALAAQMRTVNEYRKNWVDQRNYYWQMAWRMPALKPGTILLATSLPFSATSDYALGFVTNMIYAPDLDTTQTPYWYLSALRYRYGIIPDFHDGLPVVYTERSIRYEGSTSAAVVLDEQDGNACMRVLTRQDDLDPKLTREEVELSAISHPERILNRENLPISPDSLFGPEPAHEWCYYYERADLARQFGDWKEADRLFDQATTQGYRTKYGWELQPFIEASAMLGDWQQAQELTRIAAGMTASMEPALCNLWQRIDQAAPPSPARQSTLDAIKTELSCQS